MEALAGRFSVEDKSLARALALGTLAMGVVAFAPSLLPICGGVIYAVWRATGVKIPTWVAATLLAATAIGVIVSLVCMWTGVGVAAATVLAKVIITCGSVSG